MRRNKAQGIGDLLRQFLRSEGLETPLNEHRLICNAWPEVVGHGMMAYTGDMFIKNQTLFVKIKSPALRSNLSMIKTSLVKKLNDYVGAQVITNIVFN